MLITRTSQTEAKFTGKTLNDLPANTPLKNIRVKIPDSVKWLDPKGKFKEGYIVSFHNNGTGLFVTDNPFNKSVRLYPVYPETRRSVLDWEIVEFTEPKNLNTSTESLNDRS